MCQLRIIIINCFVTYFQLLFSRPHKGDSPKQHNKSIHLYTHANQGPAQKDRQNPSKESPRTFPFVSLEEEPKAPLQSCHKGQPRQEQDLVDQNKFKF